MKLKVYPVGEDDEDRYWLLELTDNRVTLTDHKDRIRGDWSAKKGVKRFQMPDFWASKKGFGIDTDKGPVALELTASHMRKVKEFVDRQYVRDNPNAATMAVVYGLLMTLGGAALAIVALIVTIRTMNNEQGGVVWYGGIIFGPIIAARGVMKLMTYFRYKRLAEEGESDEDE